MRNGVLIERCSFHIDGANRVVVCILECDMQFKKHPAYLCIDGSMFSKRFPNIRWGCFTVTGKARCNPNDVFDEEVGKRIAEGRAKTKMLSIANRVYELCAESLDKMADACYLSAANCEFAMALEGAHVNELTK